MDALFSAQYFAQVSPYAFGGLLLGFSLAFLPFLVGSFFRAVYLMTGDVNR